MDEFKHWPLGFLWNCLVTVLHALISVLNHLGKDFDQIVVMCVDVGTLPKWFWTAPPT